jgi:predicted nucleic acid-binding protein
VAEAWVINASPVILLAKVGLITHVPPLAEPLVIPEPVAEEIRQSRSVDAAVAWINGPGRQFVRPAVVELSELRGTEIGLGERAVISWAAANHGFIAVVDDHGARVGAQRLGVPVLGTVGVILGMKKAGFIREVKAHLIEIRRIGGYIGNALFREALHRAGEQE